MHSGDVLGLALWAGGNREWTQEAVGPSGNASQRADPALTREGGGAQTEGHQKAIPLKTFFKKKTKNDFYHLWSTNVNFLISAFIIYNCPKKTL